MNQPRRYNVERSCLRCHERKVRCDKRSPCSKCVRLNVPCQYPGPERVKRRAPKTPDTDVVTRLEKLEQAIISLAEGPSPAQSVTNNVASNSQSSRETSAASSSRNTRAAAAESSSTQHGFLVGDGAYMDEPFLSRVVEKEKELQSVIGSPRTGSGIPGKQPRLKADGILLNPLIAHNDVKALLPSRWQATILWDAYLQRVDPVLKLLHIPTYKARIFAAISRPDSAPGDVHSLLFAIFYGATTAMCSDNPDSETAKEDLGRYQVGLQLSIFQASFLDAPTLLSLQAMAIYIMCLRCNNSGRAGFNLRGLVTRAAQSIGLHRDGKNFRLSPLECELRRRLWWLLYATDARLAEDHGITMSGYGISGDAEVPANIDDKDIDEGTKDPVPSQPRWTEMSFTLVIIHFNQLYARLPEFEKEKPEQTLKRLDDILDDSFMRYCDPDIPIQRLGLVLSRVLKSKIEVQIRQKALQCHVNSSSMDPQAAQELLATAVRGLDHCLQMYNDDLLRGFRWLTSTHTQLHILTYVLWQLCLSPAGPHVEDAWRSINIHFDLAEKDPSWPDPGPKWPMLVQLRAKALRIRAAHFAAASKSAPPVFEGVTLEEVIGQTPDPATEFLDMNSWDFTALDFPDIWDFMTQEVSFR